jgi:hypothetical protein
MLMQVATVSSDLGDCARKGVNPKYNPGQTLACVNGAFQVLDLKIKPYN